MRGNDHISKVRLCEQILQWNRKALVTNALAGSSHVGCKYARSLSARQRRALGRHGHCPTPMNRWQSHPHLRKVITCVRQSAVIVSSFAAAEHTPFRSASRICLEGKSRTVGHGDAGLARSFDQEERRIVIGVETVHDGHVEWSASKMNCTFSSDIADMGVQIYCGQVQLVSLSS